VYAPAKASETALDASRFPCGGLDRLKNRDHGAIAAGHRTA
jgi:hypothetical protein